MKNVIIGTAGHVDHGKTSLIKALTGIDTDRLKEEKKRGITIELGFANLSNDEDLRIGIIDVPGHEKFVKNMLAGVLGIDVALLIISMDEGIKPQTMEHFEILKMLNIKSGIIVFTKSDLENKLPFEYLNEDVNKLVKGSFFESAERIQVSAYTGQNIAELKNLIIKISKTVACKKNDVELTRLFIDRVFTMEGFGTIVTGTLVEGSIKIDDLLTIYPSCIDVKVRNLQSHTETVKEVSAGQRVAINLSNVKKEMIDRGNIICVKDSIILTKSIDVELKLFDTTNKKIKNNDKVHINFASKQTECKVILLDCDEVGCKESAFAQLKFEKEIAIKKDDLFILRFLSPVESMAGGRVLDVLPKKHKRRDEELISYLKKLENSNVKEQIESFIFYYSEEFFNINNISIRLHITRDEVIKNLTLLLNENKILKIGDCYITKLLFDKLEKSIIKILDDFYLENKIVFGINREELKNKIVALNKIDKELVDFILDELIVKKVIEYRDGMIKKYGISSGVFDENKKISDDIEKIYRDFDIEVMEVDEVLQKFKDKKTARLVLNDLVKNKKLIKIDDRIFMHIESFNEALEKIYVLLDKNKKITLAETRDLFNTSRKYALYILDTCDKLKITKREGDYRVLLKKILI